MSSGCHKTMRGSNHRPHSLAGCGLRQVPYLFAMLQFPHLEMEVGGLAKVAELMER